MTDEPREKPLPIIIEQEVELDPAVTSHESVMERAALAVAGSILLAMLLVKVLLALVMSAAIALVISLIAFNGWTARVVTTALLAPAIYLGWTWIANRRTRRGRRP